MQDWPIFVISLADASERRAAISAQLDALGLRGEIVDAVDGRAGLPARYQAMVDRPGTFATFGRRMTDGEYACALSHLGLYRRIRDEGLPGAIVLEDDAILGPAFARFLQGRAYRLGDLIQMDHYYGYIWKYWGRRRTGLGFELARWSQNSCLTTAYSISARAAAYILDHALPLRATADWPCDLRAMRPMLTLPRIVDHPETNHESSTLEAGREAAESEVDRFSLKPLPQGPERYLLREYWRRRWIKLVRKRITEQVS